MQLLPFEPTQASLVLSWLATAQETFFWSGRRLHPLEPEVFAEWHRDPDVQAFLLCRGEQPVAYGEIWHDEITQEAELARILVDPAQRGQGLAGELARRLMDRLDPQQVSQVFVRIVPFNTASIRCFSKLGFTRFPADKEQEINELESVPFAWFGLSCN